jgi:FMN-dependent NADH-azoreductase
VLEFPKGGDTMSIKTLVISYLPGGEISNTKKLLDFFLKNVTNTSIENTDLTQSVPDYFMPTNLAVYYERNYGGKKVEPAKQALMKKMDALTNQVKNSDAIVLAYPMHNFSIPAAVKAWFDSVMQKGETWDMGSKGFYGKMTGKKALVLSTSGGVYEGNYASFDLATPLVKTEFQFMGFSEIEFISAGGMNSLPDDKKKESIEKSLNRIREVIVKWF